LGELTEPDLPAGLEQRPPARPARLVRERTGHRGLACALFSRHLISSGSWPRRERRDERRARNDRNDRRAPEARVERTSRRHTTARPTAKTSQGASTIRSDPVIAKVLQLPVRSRSVPLLAMRPR